MHYQTQPVLRRAAAGIMMLSLVASPAMAMGPGSDFGRGGDASPYASRSPLPASTFSPRPSHSPEGSPSFGHGFGRLDESKLRFCKEHQDHAVVIMKRIDDRVDKQLATFDAITQRVETFYTTKGHTLANYAELVVAVNAAKAAATADLAKLKADGQLDCNGDDPKGNVTTFRADAQKLITDLKAYRSALKDLIKGVRSVNQPSASPEGDTQ